MAKFSTYAEVVGEAHPLRKAYLEGLTPRSGSKLSDILRHTGGSYETTVFLPPQMREDLRLAAQMSSDDQLRRLSEQEYVPVSLEHLRGLDGDTLIAYGARLQFEGEEGPMIAAARGKRPQ